MAALVLAVGQVVLVWYGFSYMGLAYASILSAAAQAAVLFARAPEHMLFRPSFRGMRSVASFGSKIIVSNVLMTMTAQSAQVIIGAVTTVSQAALFGRANTIGRIYNQTIPKAVEPLIRARIGASQRAGEDGINTIVQYSRFMLTISMAFFGFSAVTADLIVPLVYGGQWSEASPAMVVISLGLVFWPLNSPTTTYLVARDKLAVVVRSRLFNLVFRVGLLFLLTPYGLVPASMAVLLSAYFNTAQLFHALRRHCGVDLKLLLLGLVRPFMTGLAPVALTLACKLALEQGGMRGWTLLGTLCAIMAALTLVSLILLKHPIVAEFKLTLQKIARRKAPLHR